MKKSKRLLALLMALALTAGLAACSPDAAEEENSTDPSAGAAQNEETLVPGETESGTQAVSDTQPVSGGDDVSVAPGNDEPANSDTPSTTAPKAETNDPTKMTTAQLVNYYNTAANNAKAKAKSIVKTQTLADKVKDPEISSSALQAIAPGVMNLFLSSEPKDANETYSSAADKNANFPVRGQSYASKLTASDVSSATCKKSGSNYVVTLKVKGASAGKALNTVKESEVRDGMAKASSFGVKLNSLSITNGVGTITATIDANGRLLSASYEQSSINITLNVKIPLFSALDAKVVIRLCDWFTINW